MIGAQPVPHARRSSLRQEVSDRIGKLNYGLQKRRRTPECYITCTGRTDGAGGQILAVMSTMLVAREVGLTYVHTPFTSVSHRPDADPGWTARWEGFANLGADELSVADVEGRSLRRVALSHSGRLWKRKHTLFAIAHCSDFANERPDRYRCLVDRFAAKYEGSPKDVPLHARPGALSIAVHIRRGDVYPNTKRYTGTAYVASIVDQLLAVADVVGVSTVVNVYSEGREQDFPELRGRGFSFHLDESPFAAFHNLVRADVLVMAKSQFSYAAALLSRGIKIYEPYWRNPLSDWIVVSGEGTVDAASFRERVEKAAAAW